MEGFALADQGRLGEAKRHFRRVIRTVPKPKKGKNPYPLDEANYMLGAILCNEGRYEEAIKYSDASLKLDPTYDGPKEIRDRAIRALEVKKELASSRIARG